MQEGFTKQGFETFQKWLRRSSGIAKSLVVFYGPSL
jgi:hypothetical protein